MSVPVPFSASGGIVSPQEWMDGILPSLPNVPENVAKFEILTVMRDFFGHSEAWRDWFGPIVIYPGQLLYTPELTDYKAELVNILNSRRTLDGLPLRISLREDAGDPAGLLQTGSPSHYHVTPEGQLAIWPQPAEDTTETVLFYASMQPIDLCVPTWIRAKHFDAIVNGVLGRIYAKPGPNLNMQLASWYQRRYISLRNKATVDALGNNTAVVERAQANPYFARGSQRIRAGYSTNGNNWS